MRLLLQGLVILSTAAAPQPRSLKNVEVPEIQVESRSSKSTRQVSLLEEKRMRVRAVEKKLDTILEDVVQMKPEEVEMLDPILVDLYLKTVELDEVITMSQDGIRQGFISSDGDLEMIQGILEEEVSTLEEVVTALRVSLDQYFHQQIDI